jgi:hypothetical protein
MRCSKCGGHNPTGKRFCGNCGVALTNPCPKCGAENPGSQCFCGDCGTALLGGNSISQSPRSSSNTPDIAISAQQAASAVTDGERKTITAMFADLKGYRIDT